MTSTRTWVKLKLDNVEELKEYFEVNPLTKDNLRYFSESFYDSNLGEWDYGLLDEAFFKNYKETYEYLISLGFKPSDIIYDYISSLKQQYENCLKFINLKM